MPTGASDDLYDYCRNRRAVYLWQFQMLADVPPSPDSALSCTPTLNYCTRKSPFCTASALAQYSKVAASRVALRAVRWHECCIVEDELNFSEVQNGK